MPYYHIRVKRIGKRPPYIYEFDLSKKTLETLLEHTRKEGELFLPESFESIKERDIEDIDIAKTSKKSLHYGLGRLKGISIFEEGKIVTAQFVKKPLSKKAVKKSVVPTQKTLSKNVFIVHGRDYEPLKELKAMLKEFGLNPIVLHEKPSGSRTIVEKLEKFSDVGYAFVILTPDDGSFNLQILEEIVTRAEAGGISRKHKDDVFFNSFLSILTKVARQNVILEFGYFMGLLGRDRVCCLYKGDVKLPSDMHGIVYIPFRESVNEVIDKIIKELKAVGYEIKLEKPKTHRPRKRTLVIRPKKEGQ